MGISAGGWLTIRRALAIAQLIGFDRTDGDLRAQITWFRLICADRFLSLILGLPLAVAADDGFANLHGDCRLDLERIHAVVSGRIIARNGRMQRRGGAEENETHDIDTALKQAALSLPLGWWTLHSLTFLTMKQNL